MYLNISRAVPNTFSLDYYFSPHRVKYFLSLNDKNISRFGDSETNSVKNMLHFLYPLLF